MKSVKNKGMDKFVDFHKQLMQHNIDNVMSYIDFLKMFATDEETIAKINALCMVLPNLLGIDDIWLSITTGEILSMIMSIYYFMKYRKIWSEK